MVLIAVDDGCNVCDCDYDHSHCTMSLLGSIGQVVNFCKDLPEGARVGAVLTGALPRLQVLVEDSSDHVRCSLASVIMGLAIIIGKDK